MDMVVVLAVLLCFSGVCYMLLGARLIRGTREAGILPIGLSALVIGVWVLGGALEMMASSYFIFSVGRVAHFVGTALVPVALLVCFREYTGATTSRTLIGVLLIVPICSIAVAATNPWHEFMWYLPATNAEGDFLTRPEEWGPWYLLLHAPYSYALVLTGIAKLVLHSTAVGRAHRRGLLMLAAAAAVPILAVAVYDFGIGPSTMSFVPVVFAAMLPVYAWLLVGEQIIEFSPIAYETVFQNMQDPVVVLDDQQRVVGMNRGAESLLNVSESSALRAPLDTLFGDEAPEVYETLTTGEPRKMMTTTGRFLHVQVSPISGTKAAARSGRVLMFRDVSDVERAQQEVRNSERLLRTLVDHSVNGIIRLRWRIDVVGQRTLRCVFANSAAAGFLNVPAKYMIDCTVDELVSIASSGMTLSDAAHVLKKFQVAVERGDVIDVDVRVGDGDGGKWLHVIGEPVGDEIAVTFVDITDKKAKELQMESIAWTDPLTGVLNRRGFEREAAKRLAESTDDATGALLFIDLNQFKRINDDCGHQIGDALLTIAAERLRKGLRPSDIIGRPGGDEFVALVPDVSAERAGQIAERLTDSLEEQYVIGQETLHCSASIGLAVYPGNANTLTGLLRAADQAMYRAKARAHNVTDIGRRQLLEKAV